MCLAPDSGRRPNVPGTRLWLASKCAWHRTLVRVQMCLAPDSGSRPNVPGTRLWLASKCAWHQTLVVPGTRLWSASKCAWHQTLVGCNRPRATSCDFPRMCAKCFALARSWCSVRTYPAGELRSDNTVRQVKRAASMPQASMQRSRRERTGNQLAACGRRGFCGGRACALHMLSMALIPFPLGFGIDA